MEQEVVNDSSLSLAKGDNTSEDERKGRYKPSYYNFLFDAEDGTHLIYNTMSGGFAAVNDEEFADLKLILDDPNGFQSDTERKTQYTAPLMWMSYNKDVDCGKVHKECSDETKLMGFTNQGEDCIWNGCQVARVRSGTAVLTKATSSG
jgi:hypothetical protein